MQSLDKFCSTGAGIYESCNCKRDISYYLWAASQDRHMAIDF